MNSARARRPGARQQVAWITNFDAPYRRPVWSSLAADVDLRVWLLQGQVSSDRGANRSADWDHRTTAGLAYRVQAARTVRLRRGGESFYTLLRPSSVVADAEAVFLGGWESPAYWQVARAARRRDVRLVGFYESHTASSRHSSGPVARLRGRWFRGLDAVVVPGVASRRSLLELGVPDARIIEGFNAVDVTALREDSLRLRRASTAGHRFLYVGQLIARKNVDTLISAFAEAAGTGDTLTIAGQGPLRESLERLALERDVLDRVRFVGHVPYAELPRLFGEADTLVLPSSVEVWGLVVNEALACGLRAVVSDRAGVAPSVEGMPGVVVTTVAEADLARSLLTARAIELDPEDPHPILDHTPEAFAQCFRRAMDLSIGNPLRGR